MLSVPMTEVCCSLKSKLGYLCTCHRYNHRCQKPVKLYAEILRKNAKEGDKIFDSHLGSGSSRIAAYGLGFDFYATEIDEEYFEAQEERFHRECFGEIKTERGTLVQTNLFDK